MSRPGSALTQHIHTSRDVGPLSAAYGGLSHRPSPQAAASWAPPPPMTTTSLRASSANGRTAEEGVTLSLSAPAASKRAGGGGGSGPGGRYASDLCSPSSAVAASSSSLGGIGLASRGDAEWDGDDGDEGDDTLSRAPADTPLRPEDSVASGRLGEGGTFFTALLR